MVQTKNLSYQYPGSAPIIFPDFNVEAGHPLLICGESGCGKTTLLHLLAGLRRPTNGQVLINGDSISDLPPSKMDRFRGQHIGIVYQQSYFIESLSILDNLLTSPYSGSKDKARTTASRLNIGDFLSRYPNQLSMGQQQRATIARAVMNEPKLILADEPTSALDNKNCAQVINLLLEEAVANHAALIIVTHDDRLRSEVQNSIELNTISKM
ncbi:MAG: ATP-binding cassette domain-containing protein [Bacteroidota bacterium]